MFCPFLRKSPGGLIVCIQKNIVRAIKDGDIEMYCLKENNYLNCINYKSFKLKSKNKNDEIGGTSS